MADLANWAPISGTDGPSTTDKSTQSRIRGLEEQAYGLRRRLNEIEEFLHPAAHLEENGKEAKRRVASIGLLETLTRGPCPFCGTEENHDHAEEWGALRQRLNEDQKAVSSSVRTLRKAGDQVKEDLAATQKALAQAYNEVRDQKQDNEDVAAKRTLQMRQGTAIGRAREMLKLYETADQASELRSKRDRLQSLLEAVEERLDSSEGVDAAASIVVRIGASVEKWAPRVGLHDFAKRVRLDIGRLAMVADTDDGPVTIETLGGGINWEAYHVVSHLAIHRELRSRGRPVPAFLFLDQPSQVGLPQHPQSAERLSSLFRLLEEFVSAVIPGFQIIVTEVLGIEGLPGVPQPVHVLKDDAKLVPADWIKD